MRRPSKKFWITLVIIIVVVAGIRMAMPYFVTRYVNKTLSELKGYEGSVEDIDIHLLRGAYQIHELRIFKKEGNKKIPFVHLPSTDLAIEWPALLDGKITGEIKFIDPKLNFIFNSKSKQAEQSGQETDWTVPIKKLMPLQVNRLRITNGKINFYDFSTEPQVDLFLSDLQLDAQNLNNTKENPEDLPSRIYMTANSIGDGQLNLVMKANLLKQIPDLDANLKFEKVRLSALNDFFSAYARVDVEQGQFNVYSEVAVLNGQLSGYIKPLLTDLKVAEWKKDKKKPVEMLWESLVGTVAELLENQKEDQLATRVALTGTVDNVQSPFWPTLWSIFSNAFVTAFENNTEGTVNLASLKSETAAGSSGAKTEKSKKEKRQERRERRKERRAERKQEKEKREKKEAKENQR